MDNFVIWHQFSVVACNVNNFLQELNNLVSFSALKGFWIDEEWALER